MEAAVRSTALQLSGARAAEARAYLDRRGLARATRDRFEIGYAPDSRTALLEHLTGKGFPRERLAEAGLIGLPRDGGSPYDRFRGRIIFPIRDARGRAIAFGARAIAAGQEPKYLNSPDTPLFDKGRTLYNVGPARAAAGKAGTVIVTEGYMDVIALAQAGLRPRRGAARHRDHRARSSRRSGSSRPSRSWRSTATPPGSPPRNRLIDLALPLLGPGRSLRFALMPAGQDPDDVVRGGGAAAMQALLDASRPIVDLLWARETEGQRPRQPRAPRGARRPAARPPRPDRRRRAPRPLGARDPRPPRRPLRAAAAARRASTAAASGRRRVTPQAVLRRASGQGLAPRRPARRRPAEARIRESAILAGCLNHPAARSTVEDRLERLDFRCRGSRPKFATPSCPRSADPYISRRRRRGCAAARRLGRDPLPELAALGQVRAQPATSAPAPNRSMAARAIDEELTRHAALTGRAAEIREAADRPRRPPRRGDHAPLRAAAEAEQTANIRPLEDDRDGDQSEHLEFDSVIEGRREAHASRENAEPDDCESPIRKRQPHDPAGPAPRPGPRWSQPDGRKRHRAEETRGTRPTAAARCST